MLRQNVSAFARHSQPDTGENLDSEIRCPDLSLAKLGLKPRPF